MHALALQYLRRDAAVLHLATCLVADCDDTLAPMRASTLRIHGAGTLCGRSCQCSGV